MKTKVQLFIAIISFACLLTSCKKDSAIPIPKPLTKTEILTKKPWQVDELIHNIKGVNTQYIRGGINTAGINYDVLRFVFNANGTGTHVDQFGKSYSLVWKFLSSDERNIRLTVNLSTVTTYDWNLVQIADSTLNATVKISSKTGDILESFRLGQVK